MFFNKLLDLLNDIDTEFANSRIVGGDFNIIFDQDLDGHGGTKKRKESVKINVLKIL